MPNLKVADLKGKYKINSATETPYLHNGFYFYENEIYTSKEHVLETLIAKNDLNGGYYFYYNDHVFKKINWSEEPDQSLESLYIQRAKQLREEYDYLVLSYSGGTDSHEILMTFLENDIFLDEIQTVHHHSLSGRLNENVLDKLQPLSYFNEYTRNVLPTIQYVRDKSPNTKISMLDASDYLIDETINGKYRMFGHDGTPSSTRSIVTNNSRTIYRFQHYHNQKTLNRNKKIAYIEGIEKPCFEITDGLMRFRFSDQAYQSTKYINSRIVDDYIVIENFFWSVEAPFIPVKQVHVIKKVLENNKDIRKIFQNNRLDVDRERLFCPYIYKYSGGIFSARKSNFSSEFFLIETLFKDAKPFEAANEYNNFMRKKYSKFSEIKLKETIFSQQYNIGHMNYDN